MERDAFNCLVFGREPSPARKTRPPGDPGDTLRFLRFVATRVAYLHDQVYRALPGAIHFFAERADTISEQLHDVAFPGAADRLADVHDRLARLFSLQEELDGELEAGSAILSYAADAALREAQGEVRADDAALSAAHQSFRALAAAQRLTRQAKR